MLVSLGQKVLLPSWLEECWNNRNDLYFNPVEEALLLKHRIGIFESLKVYVTGFDEEYTCDIKSNVVNFNGRIVDEPAQATHVVVNVASETNFSDTLSIASNQRVVTAEWVWTSISIQYCANEDAYAPDMKKFSKGLNTGSRSSVLSTAVNRSCRSEGNSATVWQSHSITVLFLNLFGRVGSSGRTVLFLSLWFVI
ncbi:BRCA1 protein [Ancylostoma caninum]|uniref:BRCA1 protein n=1 Tax=Ancylostoma caninum TaxID=29170 RepID=A0A368GWA1_ANCCA|nr:BRCA1 protein [Ancylostoma caninum]